MKKRILSVLLVVAMLASMVVMPAYAAGTATQSATTTEATNAKTICPCCGRLYTEIPDSEWINVTETTDSTYQITSAGHYRLMNDISGGNTINIADIEDANVDKFVFDLNGWTINGTSRGFYSAVDKSTPAARDELYVVDSVGTGKVAVKATYKMGGCFYYGCDLNINIYGGTWTVETGSTSGNTGSLNSSNRTFYLRDSNATFYGGTFDMSQESLPSKGFAGVNSGYSAVITVNGGTFIGGELYTDTCGDFNVSEGCTMVINGGDIQGKVYGAEGTSISVSGSPKISNLDLTAVGTVTVGELTEGADIRVTKAVDTAFTQEGVSADYAQYFYGAANRYSKAYALGTGALALDEAVCPHCNKTWSEIEWQEWTYDNSTENVKLSGVTGHFYLTEDKSVTSGKKFYLGAEDGDTNTCDICLDMSGYDYTNTKGGFFYLYSKGNHTLGVIDSVGGSEVNSKNTGGGYKNDGSNYTSISPLYVSSNNTVKLYDIEFTNTMETNYSNGGYSRGLFNFTGNSVLIAERCTFNASVAHYGGVASVGSGSATFTDCVINGCAGDKKATGAGGAIYTTTGAITLDGCTVSGDSAGKGGVIYATSGAITINGGTVSGSSGGYGGAIYSEGGNISITDAEVRGNGASAGGAIYYTNASDNDTKLTIENSTIYGGETTSNGGVMYLRDNTITEITDSTIYGGACAEEKYGGVAFVFNTAAITIENSTVYSGTASATSDGLNTDGVYGSGDIIIKNSTVEDISSSNDDKAAVTLIGNVEGNLHLATKAKANIDQMTDGNIVVYAGVGAFTAALADDTAASAYLDNFTSGVTDLSVKVKDAALTLEYGAVERYCPHCEKTVEFTSFIYDGSDAGDFIKGGHYYLAESSSSQTSEVEVRPEDDAATENVNEAEVIIDLNGNDITNKSRVFSVSDGRLLYLMDSIGGSQVEGGYTNKVGSVIHAGTGAKVVLHGGTYTQYARSEGSYTKGGGIIYLNAAELIVENDVVISGGTTIASGGNIYANEGSTVTIKDNARVIDGFSAYRGGNIYAKASTVKIQDNALVSGGEASDGGNMFLLTGSSLIMTGGTIKDGVARDHEGNAATTYSRGGNVYLGSDGVSTISGGTISGGISEGDRVSSNHGGGNLYVFEGGNLTISGDAVITGGSAKTVGGNIFVFGDLTLESSAVSAGTAVECGNDIYATSEATLNIGENVTGNLGLGFADACFSEATPYGSTIVNTAYGAAALNAGLTLTLDGSRGNVPIDSVVETTVEETTVYQLVVKDGGVAVVDIDGNCEYFADPADAVDAFDQSTDMWLMVCGADEIVLTKDAWIDVNGCDFTVSGDYTASFIDSSNDDYESFGWVTLNGASLGNGNSVAANTTTYYTVKGEDGRYSFHLLDMEITAVSLKTRTGGLYYYAKWYCDDTMKGQIETFGIATQLGSMPTDLTADTVLYSYMSGTELVSGVEQVGATMNNIISTTPIEGYTNDQRGEMKVYAAPYVCLKNGDDVIGTTEIGWSLRDCCDSIDATITELLAKDPADADAANYIAYMTNLFTNVWKDMDLTWTFINFPAVAEQA